MKKVIALVLALILVLSLAACGGNGKQNTNTETSDEKWFTPTKESVAEGIKFEFKDPDSVQISDGVWAYVEKEKYGEEDHNQCYIIATVHAKNSFGGYADPETYIIHYNNGKYTMEGTYVGNATQGKFEELGCGGQMSLY